MPVASARRALCRIGFSSARISTACGIAAAWRLIAFGQVLVASGAAADLISRHFGNDTFFPSRVEPLYIAGCAALGLGLLLVLRSHDASRARNVVIDSVS